MKSETTPQLENGHFHIANELFEAIISKMPCRVPGPLAIFLAVMRETYGFNRKSAEISTERFKKLTGIEHRNNIYRAIKEATECNLISAIKNDGRINPTYSIQKNYNKWIQAIKNDCAIKNDGGSNQKRLLQQSKMMADCILKTPSKDTSKDSTGSVKKKRCQIPEDFILTEDLKAFASKQGINGSVETTFDQFCDYHRAKGDTMLDWTAAWRTWVRNEIKFSKHKGSPKKYGVERTMQIFAAREHERRKQEKTTGCSFDADGELLPTGDHS